jgi:hypothetical protein
MSWCIGPAGSIHGRRSLSASLDCMSLRHEMSHHERTPQTISQCINRPPHTDTPNEEPQREEQELNGENHGAFLMVRRDVRFARFSQHPPCDRTQRPTAKDCQQKYCITYIYARVNMTLSYCAQDK